MGAGVLRRVGAANWLTAIVVALGLAGCAQSRPMESAEIRTELPREAVALDSGSGAGAAAPGAMAAKAGTQGARIAENQTILALSGGGADGAYGAGILVGWGSTGKRPRFDIVTGVSTGAFMAALAFAGPKYDAQLRELYTNRSNADIYIDKGAAGLATESLFDDTPLRKEIERVVTKSFLADIAAEHAAGRRLYIATTNLDAGDLVVWDMGQIASGNRADPLQMFQKVLRASAAVPGFFPPVYIKPQKGNEQRQAHVDGGLKAPVLIRSVLFEQPARQRSLYVVINGTLGRLNAKKAIEANVKDIGRKSITELLRTNLESVLYQGYVLARNSSTDFNLTAIPDTATAANDALDFDKTKMRALFRLGYDFGRAGNGWQKEPPRLSDLERVATPKSPHSVVAASPVTEKPAPSIAPAAGPAATALVSER
jgi:predicted acylesterase/phospholipase RssA